MTVGVIIGKFMPLHKGHEYLINFGLNYVDELYILVDHLESETIPIDLRVSWVKKQFSTAKVKGFSNFMPQKPDEHIDFWNYWSDEIKKVIGVKIDFLISSMDYGEKLANKIGCDFIDLDFERESIKICATDIRKDIFLNWDFLSNPVKEYYLKKICFIGPESTGKSVAAKILAKEFNTIHVPEYAKTYLKKRQIKGYQCLEHIAVAQSCSEEALIKHAYKIAFLDTDVLTTAIWSVYLFGYITKKLEDLIINLDDRTYILFNNNVPWINDVHRNVKINSSSDDERLKFFKLCQEILNRYNKKYIIVNENSYEKRIEQIKKYCLDELLVK